MYGASGPHGSCHETLMGALPGESWCLCFIDGESKVLTQERAVNGKQSEFQTVGKPSTAQDAASLHLPFGSIQEGLGGPVWTAVWRS